MSNQNVIIDHRFRGPLDSGNGGYVCGAIATSGMYDILKINRETPVQVTLKLPPPLDTPLQISATEGIASLNHQQDVIGVAEVSGFEHDVPSPPSDSLIQESVNHYSPSVDKKMHECFVCGPKRKPKDGLRILPAPFDDTKQAVALWQTDETLDDGQGNVLDEITWAALDCPGYFAHRNIDSRVLLARMTAAIYSQPKIGKTYIALGWAMAQEGRKYFSGTALFNQQNDLIARSEQLWIELKTG